MHYLDSQTLSEYISTIVLDDNEKLSINEVLEVLIGVGKVYPRRFVTFYFLLGSSIQCLLSVGIRSYFIQRNICRKTGKMYLFIVEEYFSVEVRHNLRITLMKNTPRKSFSFDFIHFKYCF